MKSFFTTVLLVGFIGVAVFGFAGVNHSTVAEHDSGCIMAVANGTDCPSQASTADYLDFHLSTFKSFSTATFGEMLISSLAVLLLMLGLGSAVWFLNATPPLSPVYVRQRQRDFLDFSTKQELRSWLALQEHSPTSL